MESLALAVAIRLLISFLLAAVALIVAVRYARARVSLRAVVIAFVASAVDLAILGSTGQVRAYIVQWIVLIIAMITAWVSYQGRSRKLQ